MRIRVHAAELLTTLWQKLDFRPNDQQAEAILYGDGPLFLPAGPGSGKTRTLMWRVVNLIAVRDVPVERMFVATFTEKAARQLREGLRTLLGLVTETTGRPFDTANLYVGTVHSLCQRLIHDRRIPSGGRRSPVLLDELSQYLFLRRRRVWKELVDAAGGDDWDNTWINTVFGRQSKSRHVAITHCQSLFNRLSDECCDPGDIESPAMRDLLKMFAAYRELLAKEERVDFATLQQEALDVAGGWNHPDLAFEHVIVDEYQDTNTIQERLFFRLAGTHRNLCVVGDDDQALYRFRGATVENLVEFPNRCRNELGVEPHTIELVENYRSRKKIVEFGTKFMSMCDWRKGEQLWDHGSYRIEGKRLHAFREGDGPAVVASGPGTPDEVCREIATLTCRLIDQKVVANPNQVAFLFPSLKPKLVGRMRQSLCEAGLEVYAPRAGRFLEVDEAKAMFGLLFNILGNPGRGSARSRDYVAFHDWVDETCEFATALATDDDELARYVERRRADVTRSATDSRKLLDVARRNRWDLSSACEPDRMLRALAATSLSEKTASDLHCPQFERLVRSRSETANPVSLRHAFNRATSLPWTILDLFHEFCGFSHFRQMFERAEASRERQTIDEGPLCNLGLVSQYLGRFVEEFHWFITGERLATGWYPRVFGGYLYALFRRGESEYEDADDPFPKGRVPFITVHQAKGLEFPVVVLGNPRKIERPQPLEQLVQPLLGRDGEPIERQGKFDAMRLFYVALTRAKNLVVLPDYRGGGQTLSRPFPSLVRGLPQIRELDCASVPSAGASQSELPRTWSYTGDYVPYQQCPRQYFVFRQHGFVPARAQPVSFGRLVHETIDSLHRELISQRATGVTDPRVDDDDLRWLFDVTYQRLQSETGYFLLSHVTEVAWRQVQMYWRRLPHIAAAVAEPEVKLHLPNQSTAKRRQYAIDGVVDVVASDDGVTLYDIKTCDIDEIETNSELYQRQLVLYAHVWNGLRPATPVQHVAIISTAIPAAVNEATNSNDAEKLDLALSTWNPIVPIPLTGEDIQTTLNDFGRVVDLIEDGQFSPPTAGALANRVGVRTFAQRVCRNCDARFSCPSFREHIKIDYASGSSFSRRTHGASDGWRREVGLLDDGLPGEELA